MFFDGGGGGARVDANYGVLEVVFTFTLCTNINVIRLLPESIKDAGLILGCDLVYASKKKKKNHSKTANIDLINTWISKSSDLFFIFSTTDSAAFVVLRLCSVLDMLSVMYVTTGTINAQGVLICR